MSIVILGIDLGKNVRSVVGVVAAGAVIVCRSMPSDVDRLVAELPACVVAMEVCCVAHDLGGLLASRGYEIGLMDGIPLLLHGLD